MIDKDVMVLQNYTNSHGEMYPAWHHASEAMSVKTEEVSDAAGEEDPLRITVQEIKAEPEVSCMSLYVHYLETKICRNSNCLSDPHLSGCLSF
jgi:hypothetical protein